VPRGVAADLHQHLEPPHLPPPPPTASPPPRLRLQPHHAVQCPSPPVPPDQAHHLHSAPNPVQLNDLSVGGTCSQGRSQHDPDYARNRTETLDLLHHEPYSRQYDPDPRSLPHPISLPPGIQHPRPHTIEGIPTSCSHTHQCVRPLLTPPRAFCVPAAGRGPSTVVPL
jgi:hypothetical protein